MGVDIPLSPYNLLQEVYIDDPWKIMMSCIMLNLTNRRQVDTVREELFRRWPDPISMSTADPNELGLLIQPLGLYKKRAASMRRFSDEWINKPSMKGGIKDLHGIGQYGSDSWDIFVMGELPVSVKDHVLTRYVEWRNKLLIGKIDGWD